jgi:hypothetical protein
MKTSTKQETHVKQPRHRIATFWHTTAVLLLLALICFSANAATTPTFVNGIGAWGEPGAIPASPNVSMTVNGVSVQVREWKNMQGGGTSTIGQDIAVARFATTGSWTATITHGHSITSYSIRPKSRNISGTLSSSGSLQNNVLTFTVNGPDKIYVQINGLPPMMIFALPQLSGPPVGATIINPGDQNLGVINVQSGQTLWFSPGAYVKGCVKGNGVSNVRIAGYGILEMNQASPFLMVDLNHCSSTTVEGIMVVNSPTRGDCRTTAGQSSLWKDVCSLSSMEVYQNSTVTFQNCYVRSYDDAIAMKNNTTSPMNGTVRVIGCTLNPSVDGDGVTVGFELFGPTSNITVDNCDIISGLGSGNQPSGRHSAFSVIDDGAGPVSSITFNNIRCEDLVTANNLEIAVTSGQKYGGGHPGKISNILVKDVTWSSNHGVYLSGFSSVNNVSGVTFQNCFMAGHYFNSGDAQLHVGANVSGLVFQ